MKRRRKSNLLFNSYCIHNYICSYFLHIHFKKQIDVIDMVSACSSSPWETASPPQPSVLGFGETPDPHLFNETISIPWPKGLFRVGIGPKHRQLEAILGLKPRLSERKRFLPTEFTSLGNYKFGMANGHLCHLMGKALLDGPTRSLLRAQSICPQSVSDTNKHQQEASHQTCMTAQKCQGGNTPRCSLNQRGQKPEVNVNPSKGKFSADKCERLFDGPQKGWVTIKPQLPTAVTLTVYLY